MEQGRVDGDQLNGAAVVWAKAHSNGTGTVWAEVNHCGAGAVWAEASHTGTGAVECRGAECRVGQSQEVEELNRVDRFPRLSTAKRRPAANSWSSGPPSSWRT